MYERFQTTNCGSICEFSRAEQLSYAANQAPKLPRSQDWKAKSAGKSWWVFLAASAEAPYYLLLIPAPSCFSWSGRDNSLKQRGVWNTQEGGVNLLWVHDFHICCILNLVVCSKVDSCAQKAIRTDWPHQRQFLSFIMWTHGSHIRMPWSIGVKRHLFLSCGLFLSTHNTVDRIANIGPI